VLAKCGSALPLGAASKLRPGSSAFTERLPGHLRSTRWAGACLLLMALYLGGCAPEFARFIAFPRLTLPYVFNQDESALKDSGWRKQTEHKLPGRTKSTKRKKRVSKPGTHSILATGRTPQAVYSAPLTPFEPTVKAAAPHRQPREGVEGGGVGGPAGAVTSALASVRERDAKLVPNNTRSEIADAEEKGNGCRFELFEPGHPKWRRHSVGFAFHNRGDRLGSSEYRVELDEAGTFKVTQTFIAGQEQRTHMYEHSSDPIAKIINFAFKECIEGRHTPLKLE
jgi:hypothetical protein